MGFFSRKTSGVCPKCLSKIDDVNDNFCTECGWKISSYQAIKTKNQLKNKAKQEEREAKAQQHKMDFKQSIQEMKDILTTKEDKADDISIAETEIVVRPTYDTLEELNAQREELERYNEMVHIWAENNHKGGNLEAKGEIDEAIKCYEENVSLGADTPYTYNRLAALYHYKREFEKERDLLQKYINHLDKDERVDEGYKMHYVEDLKNVESYLNTGKWKYDCLPSDPQPLFYKVKEAKTLLNSEDKDKGIEMLEELMENGTYNNTVYYTLYQTYKKDKKYDDCIRVCNKALEVLGLFSNDRKSKWTNYLEKITAQKEKALSKNK